MTYIARCRVLTSNGDYFMTRSEIPLELFDERHDLVLEVLGEGVAWHLARNGVTADGPVEYLIVEPAVEGSEIEAGVL